MDTYSTTQRYPARQKRIHGVHLLPRFFLFVYFRLSSWPWRQREDVPTFFAWTRGLCGTAWDQPTQACAQNTGLHARRPNTTSKIASACCATQHTTSRPDAPYPCKRLFGRVDERCRLLPFVPRAGGGTLQISTAPAFGSSTVDIMCVLGRAVI